MKRAVGVALFAAAAVLFTQGCAHQTMTFDPGTIDPEVYVEKVDQWMIIADGSMTMADRAHHQQKMGIQQSLLASMNETIPELAYEGGFRTFGKGSCQGAGRTTLIREVADYDTAGFNGALDVFGCIGGTSPLNRAIEATGGDLAMGKRTAVVVITDGLNMNNREIETTRRLKEALGDNLDVYAIQLGGSKKGRRLVDGIVAAGGDGYVVSAHELASAEAMKNFVIDVFLWPDDDGDGVPNHLDKCPGTPRGVEVDDVGCPLDSDGDGVPDYLDKCPGTPKGVKVDADGCPLDSDGDGVPDYLDKCPGTPRGVPVDDNGCPPTGVVIRGDEWAVEGQVLFATDKAALKPEAQALLDRVAAFLQKNLQWQVEIQGHTDNTGPKAWNETLSQMRADSVKNYLVTRGVAADRLTAKGFGWSEPIASNDTAEGRQQNRRVDFRPTEK